MSEKKIITEFDKDWILYEDRDIIIVNKLNSIPVQNDKSNDPSLYFLVQKYCGCDLQLIHRLDRPVSGAVIFAKNLKAAIPLFLQFEQRSVQKNYYAIVETVPEPTQDLLIHYLEKKSSFNRSIPHLENGPKRKKAILNYELIGTNEQFHLLKIVLHTGRHHQIRAQLQAIGCSIKGDTKYGYKRSNRDRSINLHARFLRIAHPITRKEISVIAPFPNLSIWSSFKPWKKNE